MYGRQCKAVEKGVGEARFIYEIKIQKCPKNEITLEGFQVSLL
jgi:hypothetical protein